MFGDNQRFDSISDIKSVHEALNGWCGFRANTEALIRVLCHRNHEQLLVNIISINIIKVIEEINILYTVN